MATETLDFRINAAINAGNSAETLSDLKKSMRELSDLAAQVGPQNAEQFARITAAAGETRDRIKDVRENVAALSGTPVERLTAGFGRLRQSIFELDFDKFKQSLIAIKDGMLGLGAQLAQPFTNAGKAVVGLFQGTTTLTVAMKALGGAVAATGIGALVIAAGLLIANFDKLKNAGGLIGKTFQAVSDIMGSVLDKLEYIGNALGLIDTRAARREEARKKEQEDIDKFLKKLSDSVQKELDEEEKKYNAKQKFIEANRRQVFSSEEQKAAALRKYRLEDIKNEEEYQAKRKSILQKAGEEEIYKVESQIIKLRSQIADAERAREDAIKRGKESEYGLYSFIPAVGDLAIAEKRLQRAKRALKDYYVEVNSAETAYSLFKKGLGKEILDNATAEEIKLTNLRKDLDQEVANEQKKKRDERIAAERKAQKELQDEALKAIYEQEQARQNASKELSKISGDTAMSQLEKVDPKQAAIEKKEAKDVELKALYEAGSKLLQDDLNLKSALRDNEVNFNAEMAQINQDEWQKAMDQMNAELEYEAEIDRANLERKKQIAQDEKDLNQAKWATIVRGAYASIDLMNAVSEDLYQRDLARAGNNEKLQEESNKRNFARNKALRIGETIINTAAAIMQVQAQPAVNADITQTLRAILTGIVSAQGAAQIAIIARQQYRPGVSSGSAPSSPSVAVPSIQNPNSIMPGQFMNISDFKPGLMQEQRVFVVESDITGVQRKVRVIENRSRF